MLSVLGFRLAPLPQPFPVSNNGRFGSLPMTVIPFRNSVSIIGSLCHPTWHIYIYIYLDKS